MKECNRRRAGATVLVLLYLLAACEPAEDLFGPAPPRTYADDALVITFPEGGTPAPPVGWTPPELTWFGPASLTPPACPAGIPWDVDDYTGVTAGGACGSCACTWKEKHADPLLQGYRPKLAQGIVQVQVGNCKSIKADSPGIGWPGGAGYDCRGLPVGSFIGSAKVFLVNYGYPDVTATPSVGPDALPPVSPTARMRRCEGSRIEGAQGLMSCIGHAGDTACPEQYPDRHTIARGYKDGRSCSACVCGPDDKRSIHYDIFTSHDCSGTVGETFDTSIGPRDSGDLCPGEPTMDNSIAIGSIKPTLIEPPSAVVTPPTLTGDVTPDDVLTFCCATP